VSPSEFHPFTIASSPSDTFMEFYVKGLGNWTNELCNLAKSQQPAVPADAQRERSATAARVQFQHIGAVCGLEVCACGGDGGGVCLRARTCLAGLWVAGSQGKVCHRALRSRFGDRLELRRNTSSSLTTSF